MRSENKEKSQYAVARRSYLGRFGTKHQAVEARSPDPQPDTETKTPNAYDHLRRIFSKRMAEANPATKDGTPISGRSIVPLTKSSKMRRKAEIIKSLRVYV